MVIVFAPQAALRPVGRPLAPETPLFEIPVAKVVTWVILVSTVLIHKLGVADGSATVISAVTVMVPVAFTVPQPPVKGML